MNKPKNLKDMVFTRLTVLELSQRYNGFPTWLCRCECGNLTKVNSYKLLNGHTKSCGCLQRESRMKPKSIAGLNAVIRGYKKNAEKRQLSWKLTDSDVLAITQLPCFYCGKLPANEIKSNISENGKYIYNGIDRLDNLLGYTINNVVPCCYKCNVLKKDFSVESMKKVLRKLGYRIDDRI